MFLQNVLGVDPRASETYSWDPCPQVSRVVTLDGPTRGNLSRSQETGGPRADQGLRSRRDSVTPESPWHLGGVFGVTLQKSVHRCVRFGEESGVRRVSFKVKLVPCGETCVSRRGYTSSIYLWLAPSVPRAAKGIPPSP